MNIMGVQLTDDQRFADYMIQTKDLGSRKFNVIAVEMSQALEMSIHEIQKI
jgi:hypothetical protein